MKNKDWLQPNRKQRIFLIFISIISLGIIFIGQRFDYSLLFSDNLNPQNQFIINRSIRFLLNDNLVLLLIYGLFYDKKYVKFGLAVEAFGFFFLLIPYFILRYYTSIDHMYISFIHRLIINPTLMGLLIPAIYIQKIKN
ncbi:exosortase F system-associated protein [Marivirga salinae]|uniref:Exosortase F system-associated protein n=1 Tax=Marivirga salinarum TaxID=3059078 RepID=A0AA49GB69_9BACT|nr:exosortase F system-associated protein [Marivirga sp. BDSF4-3]WKK74017.2 exosortase F system-associated protein [Marivirga sp. BDSF4-3]